MLTVDELFKLHDELCGAGKAIMSAKNHDYRGGSGDPLANFRGSTTFGIEPIKGILLRVQDKMMRIKTFAEKGMLQVKGEGVRDALIDVINYMVLIGGFVKELSECGQLKEALHIPDPSSYTPLPAIPVPRDLRDEMVGISRFALPKDAKIGVLDFNGPTDELLMSDLGDEAHPEI